MLSKRSIYILNSHLCRHASHLVSRTGPHRGGDRGDTCILDEKISSFNDLIHIHAFHVGLSCRITSFYSTHLCI